MDLGLGSLLSGFANGISSIFTARENRKAQREANAANMELAKYQNEANVNLWREQNEASIKQWERNNKYNTPEAQLARYRDAGLNPMLIYGSGSSVAGNSSSPASIGSAPHLERAEVKPVTMPNIPFGDYIGDAYTLYMRQKQLEKDLKIGDSQNDDLIASAKAKEAEARNKDSQTRLNILNADITEAQKDSLIRAAGLKNDATEQSISESKSRESLNASNVELNATRAKELESRLKLNAETAVKIVRETELVAEKIVEAQLGNAFNRATMQDRISLVSMNLQDAIIQTGRHGVAFVSEKFDKDFKLIYGFEPSKGNPISQCLGITGTVISRFIDWLESLGIPTF